MQTANAYTDMSIPAFVSVMAKSRAMSVSNPMGMNSDVLNIKVEHVSPMSDIQFLIVSLSSIFVITFLIRNLNYAK